MQSSLAHINANLSEYRIPLSERDADSFIYVIGDKVTLTCNDTSYMLRDNKETFSYTCSQNGTNGVWIPESQDYEPACLGVFHMLNGL